MEAFWLPLLMAVSIWTISVPVSGNNESRLVNDLLSTTSRNARPLVDSSDILKMTFGLSFQSFDIDEESQTLTTISYESQGWQDQTLGWHPEKYGGVKQVFLNKDYIWTSDITLYNSAGSVEVQYGQGNAVVHPQGDILFVRTSKSKVKCDVDSLQFPFDTISCKMVYGSWVYDGYKLDISLNDEEVDLSDFKSNPTWKLTEAKCEKQTRLYTCCPEPYYTIIYTTKFVRESSHYIYILLLPCILLSVLTILLFSLPTHSQGRITLGVLIFCAFLILLLYTSSLVSGWNHLPYFVIFLIYNLITITIFTFVHSLIIKIAGTENGQGVPKVLRTLMFDILARIFCMKSVVQRNQSRQPEMGSYNQLTINSEKPPLDTPPKGHTAYNLPEVDTNGPRSLEADVAFIRSFTSSFDQKMKDGDHEKKVSREWRDLAAVINRLFFVVYKIVIVIAIIVVYVQVSDE